LIGWWRRWRKFWNSVDDAALAVYFKTLAGQDYDDSLFVPGGFPGMKPGALPAMKHERLAIFRADASVAIGAGHVARCLSLAGWLTANGWSCVLARGRGASDALLPSLPPGVTTVEFDCDAAAEPGELAALWPGGCDLFVVDHYRRDAGYEQACRPWARRILVIDDLADRPHDCEFLLDPAACRVAADYTGLVPKSSQLLLGPAYLPLRSGFAAHRRQALARRAMAEKPRRLLLSFGATDCDNVTTAVLDILAQSQHRLAVDILLGAGAPHLDSLRRKLEALPFPARLHIAIEDVAGLLAASDIAIGAGGGSAWERCCLGLPSIVTCTAGNQHAVAESLRATGAALVLEDADALSSERLVEALQGLILDVAARRRMARAAACLCDGLGAQRLAIALDPPVASDGTAIRLRPAASADAELLLAWQRDPRTRLHSRNPAAPQDGEHHAWFTSRLGDPECLLNIIMHGDAAAGVVRLDSRAEDGVYEISIYVAPECWRLGIGSAALAQARALLPGAEIWAEVLHDNNASHALFDSAGYRAEAGWYVSRPDAERALSDALGSPA
jgi:UDP-2,4-diacetamido-2,4,6-trideoxy-beta-L-altropyranose hydrolase